MRTVGKLAGGADKGDGHDAKNRQTDSGDKESNGCADAVGTCLQAQERRKDKVSRTEEHREKRDAHCERLARSKRLGGRRVAHCESSPTNVLIIATKYSIKSFEEKPHFQVIGV